MRVPSRFCCVLLVACLLRFSATKDSNTEGDRSPPPPRILIADQISKPDGTSIVESSSSASSAPLLPPPHPPYLPPRWVVSAKGCTQFFGLTDDSRGIRSTSFILDAGFEGGGKEEHFPQFALNLKTHCNFIFFPFAPFDSVAVKISYYRHICGNSLHLCLVANSTIGEISRDRPFFCGMQRKKHLVSEYAGRPRPCAAIVKDFFVPFSSPSVGHQNYPLALVIQFHALHNPIENIEMQLTAHKHGQTRRSCEGKMIGDSAPHQLEKDEDARKTGFHPRKVGKSTLNRFKRVSAGLQPSVDAVGEAMEEDSVDEGVAEEEEQGSEILEGFWCSGSKLCIWKNSTCDDGDSCLDGGSDERDCEPETTKSAKTMTTKSTTTTTISMTSKRKAVLVDKRLSSETSTSDELTSNGGREGDDDMTSKGGKGGNSSTFLAGEMMAKDASASPGSSLVDREAAAEAWKQTSQHVSKQASAAVKSIKPPAMLYSRDFFYTNLNDTGENYDKANYGDRVVDPEPAWNWFYPFVVVTVITVILSIVVVILLLRARRRRASGTLSPLNNAFARRRRGATSRVVAVDANHVGADDGNGAEGRGAGGSGGGERGAGGGDDRGGVVSGNGWRPGSAAKKPGMSRRGQNNAEIDESTSATNAATNAVAATDSGSGAASAGFFRAIISKTTLGHPALLPSSMTHADEDGSAADLPRREESIDDVTTISLNSISTEREDSDEVLDKFRPDKVATDRENSDGVLDKFRPEKVATDRENSDGMLDKFRPEKVQKSSAFVAGHPVRRDTPLPPPLLAPRKKAARDRVFVGQGGGGGGRGAGFGGGRKVGGRTREAAEISPAPPADGSRDAENAM